MAKNSVRIRLKAYEHRNLDAASEKIVKTVNTHGAKKIVGPVPLPTEKQVVTVLRAVHKYKDSREQFEIRTHKRLIEIIGPSAETIEALSRVDFASGGGIVSKNYYKINKNIQNFKNNHTTPVYYLSTGYHTNNNIPNLISYLMTLVCYLSVGC